MTRSAPALHLVRHGEVFNPDHMVYGSRSGFGLSDLGRRHAAAASRHLADRRIASTVSSPLQRAVETATIVAATHGQEVETDVGLTEWALIDRWSGHTWAALGEEFPGELDAYLEDPANLPFAPESLDALADRVVAVADDRWERRRSDGDVVIVGHQDPLETARRRLTDRAMSDFHHDKLGHGAVATLLPDGRRWREIEVWVPPTLPTSHGRPGTRS